MDNMHHIARIDFEQKWPNDLSVFSVALFDDRDLTEDEALKLIRAEAYDKRLVVMTQAQFETVFRSWMKPGDDR
jgi:hypothetical protein